MSLKRFRKALRPEQFDTAIEFFFAKNPDISKLMKKLDLVAKVTVNETINGSELEKKSLQQFKKNQNTMGAKQKENRDNLYLRPFDGAFRKYVKVATATSRIRTKTDGSIVNEELFSSVIGKIKKIYVYDKSIETKKNGKQDVRTLDIYLKEDADKNYVVIELNFTNSFAQSFLMRLENIDLRKDVILKPFTILNKGKSAEKGKDVYNDLLIPYQLNDKGEEIKVNAFWNKENQGDLPKMQEIKDKKGNKSTWVTVERDEFLEDYISGIQNKIKLIEEAQDTEVKNDAVAAGVGTPDDDLPF